MIKWGIVGLGNMAGKFANAIKEVENSPERHKRSGQKRYHKQSSSTLPYFLNKRSQ